MSRVPLRFHRPLPHRDSLPLRLHQLTRPTPLLRNLVTDGNDRLVRAVDIEVRIQILKSPLHGFRVEKVYDRKEHEIESCEDDIKAIADVLDAGRGELRADEAEEPVGGRGRCGTTRAHGEGVDFGLVDPRDHAPCAGGTSAIQRNHELYMIGNTPAKGSIVEEQERDGHRTPLDLVSKIFLSISWVRLLWSDLWPEAQQRAQP